MYQSAHGAGASSHRILQYSKEDWKVSMVDMPKAVLYEQFARIGKALSNPARLELLDLLAQGERSVEELAAAAGMKVSNTSAQLRALTLAGLLLTRRSGPRIYYRLADEQVAAFVDQVKDLARSRLASAERAARD